MSRILEMVLLSAALAGCASEHVRLDDPADRDGDGTRTTTPAYASAVMDVGGATFYGEFRVVIGPDEGCRFEIAGSDGGSSTLTGQLALSVEQCAEVGRTGMAIATEPASGFDWIYENRGSIGVNTEEELPTLHVREFDVRTDAEGELSVSLTAIDPGRIDFDAREITAGDDATVTITGRLTISCLARDPSDSTGTATILDPEGRVNPACAAALME